MLVSAFISIAITLTSLFLIHPRHDRERLACFTLAFGLALGGMLGHYF